MTPERTSGGVVVELDGANERLGDIRPTRGTIAESAPLVGHFYRIVPPE